MELHHQVPFYRNLMLCSFPQSFVVVDHREKDREYLITPSTVLVMQRRLSSMAPWRMKPTYPTWFLPTKDTVPFSR